MSCETLLEDRITKTEISTDAAIEGVISRGHVVMTPAKLPCVRCEDTSCEAAFVSSCKEGDGEFVVMRHIQLEEPRPFTISLCNIFNRRAAGSGQSVDEVEFFGNGSNREFA